MGQTRAAAGALGGWARAEPAHAVVLVLLTVWGVALRWVYMHQPIRVDEALTYTRYAGPPIGEGLLSYYHPNNHVFHSLLVGVATRVLGSEWPWAIRVPALVAGVLCIPGGYWFTRLFFHRHAAILVAGLLASSSIMIEFSTNARGYTMVCLFTLLLLVAAHRAKETSRVAAWAWFALLAAMGLWTIPLMLFPIGIAGVWLVGSAMGGDTKAKPTRFLFELFVSLAAAAAMTVVLYLPIMLTSGVGSIISNKWVVPKAMPEFLAAMPAHLAYLWRQWNRDMPVWLSAAVAVGAVVCTVCYRRCAGHRVSLVIATLLWVVPLTVARRVIYISPRIWLYLLPVYFAIATSGWFFLAGMLDRRVAGWVGAGARRSLPVVAVGLSAWIGVSVLRSDSVMVSIDTAVWPDAEAVVLYLKQHSRPHDRMSIVDQQHEPIFYYCWLHDLSYQALTQQYDDGHRLWLVLGDHQLHTLEQAVDAVQRLLCSRVKDGKPPELITTLGDTRIYLIDFRPDRSGAGH